MKRATVVIVLFALKCLFAGNIHAAGLGEWNIYMAYNNITDIEPAGKNVFVLSSGSLFSYNVNDGSIYAFNKANALNDCTIEHIAWNANAKKLIATYDNYNIDLVDNDGNVYNISDYYSKALTYDKTINHITVNGIYAYVSTNFGVLKVNMRDEEISDTYILNMKVMNCCVSGSSIFVLTDNGIYSALTSENLLDKSVWKKNETASESIFASQNDIETTTIHGYTEYRTYDNANKCWWSNLQNGTLQSYVENESGQQTITRSNITPDGPRHNHFAFMRSYGNRLYSCGSYTWDLLYDATIQTLENYSWDIYQSEGISETTGRSFKDMLCLDVDPFDSRRVMGGARNGVYEFYDGRFVKIHTAESTGGTISTAVQGSNEYELITAMCYDRNGNLWCFNSRSYTDKPLLKLDRTGNWTAYGNEELLTYKGRSAGFVKGMMADSKGNIWFANNLWLTPATYRFNTETNTLYTYAAYINQDNVNMEVTSACTVAEDLDGNIWIGTNKGPVMLTQEQIDNPALGVTQIKIPRNDGTDNADYLLANIDVSCIAVDGANRKWIGTTGNGIYLISSDNMEQTHHFLTTNSNLISNNIESIAVNNTTGEVYIGTDKGLCSYMSDATAANEDMNKDNVYAYPNPVTPGYEGLITVVGLSFNANVKILTASGAVVAEGTSNGGMFTWDGKNKDGQRVASGVYMVATAKSDGSKGTVCKIAIIN